MDAVAESNEHVSSPLSRSLLELLPTHVNNTHAAIQIAAAESADAEVLYSFDSQGPSPGSHGRKVDYSGLVERAEQKWEGKETDRIVQGEYEVLDDQGETTVFRKGKKGSPKQAAKWSPSIIKDVDVMEEDDGFELL